MLCLDYFKTFFAVYLGKSGKFPEIKLRETRFSLKETTILCDGNFENFLWFT
jgi:hypothetical protein